MNDINVMKNVISELTLINQEQNICIDQLVNTVFQNNHLNKKQQKNKETRTISSDLGIIRRRLSKVEDFTNHFYEEFESFKSVKQIITVLSNHIDECDRDISMMVSIKNNSDNKIECNEPLENLAEYFSNYDDDDQDNKDNKDDKSCICVTNDDTNETNNLVILVENNEQQNGDDSHCVFEEIIIIS